MTLPPDDAVLNPTEKGLRLRTSDNALTPSQMLTLELIVRFPGLHLDAYKQIYVALLGKMTVDEALTYVKSGELERDAEQQK